MHRPFPHHHRSFTDLIDSAHTRCSSSAPPHHSSTDLTHTRCSGGCPQRGRQGGWAGRPGAGAGHCRLKAGGARAGGQGRAGVCWVGGTSGCVWMSWGGHQRRQWSMAWQITSAPLHPQ